jgi:hypothetical protein
LFLAARCFSSFNNLPVLIFADASVFFNTNIIHAN